MTSAEKLFWSKVAQRQFANLKFRKQHGIGNYIVDFYCPGKKLIIEIDGDSHANSKTDPIRSDFLAHLGYKILRYNNRDVLYNIEGVFQDLLKNLGHYVPLYPPS